MTRKFLILFFVLISVSLYTLYNKLSPQPTEQVTYQNIEGIWLEKTGFLNLQTSDYGYWISTEGMISNISDFVKLDNGDFRFADSTGSCFINIKNLENGIQEFSQICHVGENKLELMLRNDQLKIGDKFYQKVNYGN